MPNPFYLYGSPISTYYNKVKIALIELDLLFEEVSALPGAGQWPDSGSPSGKIPYLRHGDDFIYESQAIIEYLEDIRQSQAPTLFPREPLQRAKCRELIQYIELYLDAPMHPVYQAVFWGKEMTPGQMQTALDAVAKGLNILLRQAQLTPWLCGPSFTHADSAAWVHLSTIQWALSIAGHKTFVHDHAPALTDYLQRLAQRPSISKVDLDRREASRLIKAQRAGAQEK